ncbi:MAG: asparagine synthase-related protein [Patescibacteria group bacterium]
MCGIATIIGKQASKERLQNMLQTIKHRGDKEHFDESRLMERCAIGMNRLAIVDREHAKQPMTTPDGRYFIVFNGEIYNYRELRSELGAQGCSFATDSDTEVLVQGYAIWRDTLLQKIRGMFAFIIYDSLSGDFFAARDPFGVKPLYYSTGSDGTYFFASEIKALVSLQSGNEIKCFPPATYMWNGRQESYWHIPQETWNTPSEEELVSELRTLFDEAIRRRVQTDLPVAVYLSGGIDSTSVLATARRFHPHVTAIIAGNEESPDRPIATQYCKEYSIPYILRELPSEEELARRVPEIIRITESFEPNMIRQSSVMYEIAKTAAEHGFKVTLCGEGSDELFAGYPEFATMQNASIEENIRTYVGDLHRTQLQRIDRISMAFTTEVREPFLDLDFASYALRIPARWKIRELNGKTLTKYIFRKAMEDRLPHSIAYRDKVVLSEGAGFRGNQPIGGLFYDIMSQKVSDATFAKYKEAYAEWNLKTKEEAHYFQHYSRYGYLQAECNKRRIVTNRISSLVSERNLITQE